MAERVRLKDGTKGWVWPLLPTDRNALVQEFEQPVPGVAAPALPRPRGAPERRHAQAPRRRGRRRRPRGAGDDGRGRRRRGPHRHRALRALPPRARGRGHRRDGQGRLAGPGRRDGAAQGADEEAAQGRHAPADRGRRRQPRIAGDAAQARPDADLRHRDGHPRRRGRPGADRALDRRGGARRAPARGAGRPEPRAAAGARPGLPLAAGGHRGGPASPSRPSDSDDRRLSVSAAARRPRRRPGD